ncbi:c-type cytochrome domain-containing protein [Edaphobacter modestus]|uniref:c-type cytochrome domain-containing protein n=1 Tax=Edaphobacter modestus TaxID=388466 RepID=UPI00102AE873|nr:c-type cytochrome domain-containing protein [Edaphobacter modestus]
MRRAPWTLSIAAAAILVWGMKAVVVRAGGDDEAARPDFYMTKVRPIFQSNCFRCHAGMNRRGGLSMSTRAGLMKGGRDGVVIVPGDPAKSLLMKGIRFEGPAKPMPPPAKGNKLSAPDIATIERWIRAGAVMPADAPVQ